MKKSKQLVSIILSLAVLFSTLTLGEITVNAAPGPTLSITNVTTTDATTNGGSDGTILVTTGGAITSGAQVEYATSTLDLSAIEATTSSSIVWTTGSAVGTTEVLTGYQAGTYYVYARDSFDHTNVDKYVTPAVVSEPTPVVINETTTTAQAVTTYGGSDGSIHVVATGGDNALQYKLDSGSWQSSNDFTGLSAGTYVAWARDSITLESDSYAVVVGQPTVTPVVINETTTTSQAVTAYGGSDGSIHVVATGGNTTLKYRLDAGAWQTSQDFPGLSAGDYNVRAEDATTGAYDTYIVTVSQPIAAVVINESTTTAQAVTTYGGSDGSITVVATGGDTTLEYSIDGSNWQDSPVFTGLTANSYTVKARDKATLAMDTYSVEVTQPSAPSTNTPVVINETYTTASAVTTYGGSDGGIIIMATGGDNTLVYSIDASTWQGSNVFTGLTAGSYTVKAKDPVTGEMDSYVVVVTQPSAPGGTPVVINEALTVSTAVTTYGGSNGRITVVATGGDNTLVYSLDGTTWQDSNVFAGLVAGNYTVKAKDPLTGEMDSYIVTVTQPSAPSNNDNTGSTTGTAPATSNVYTSSNSDVSSAAVSYAFNAGVVENGVGVAQINLKANAQGESSVGIPTSFLTGNKRLEVSVDGIEVKLPNGVFKSAVGGPLKLTVDTIDTDDIAKLKESNPALAEALEGQAATGKPIIDVSLLVGNDKFDDFSGDVEIEIVIPYTPTSAELSNSEAIVAYYLNDAGEIIELSMTNYDPVRGGIVLRTKHLSFYGIRYNLVSFNDLSMYGWAKDSISAMAARGIVKGTGSKRFAPGDNISRADFAVMVARFFGLDGRVTNNFSDVPADSYYYNAIGNMKAMGIVTGVGGNDYKPMDQITRQDMMVILYRTLNTLGRSGDISKVYSNAMTTYKDQMDVSAYAADSVRYMLDTGLIQGSNMTINPKNNTLRSEVAVLLDRILEALIQ